MSTGKPPGSYRSDRSRAGEWLLVLLLCLDLAWTTLRLGGFLSDTKAVTAALTALLGAVFLFQADLRKAHPAGCLWIPLLIYGAINAAFLSPTAWLGWNDWLGWAQMFVVFWVVLNGVRSAAPRLTLVGFLALLAATAGLMACYQHFVRPDWLVLGRVQIPQFIGRSSGPFGIPNSLAALALLTLPMLAWHAWRSEIRIVRAASIIMAFFVAAGFILAVSRGAWIALAIAAAVLPLFDPRRRLRTRMGMAALTVAIAAAAAAIAYGCSPLVRERFNQLYTNAGERTRPIMWKGAWRIFEDRPTFGGGVGSFDLRFEKFRPEGYQDEPVWAHNDYLNLLCDYGAVGFLLAMGAVVVTITRCRRGEGPMLALGCGLLAFALQLAVDFNLKIPALALAFSALAALRVSDGWSSEAMWPGTGALVRAVRWSLAAIIVVGTLSWAIPRYRAEGLRFYAREKINHMATDKEDSSKQGPQFREILAELDRAVHLDPANPQIWSDRSYVLALTALASPSRTFELGSRAEDSAETALQICSISPEYWVRIGVAKDMQAKWLDAGDCFVHALALAPARADIWYYQAYHLSLDPSQTEPALAAAGYCLRLDPGFQLGQALKERLASRSRSRP